MSALLMASTQVENQAHQGPRGLRPFQGPFYRVSIFIVFSLRDNLIHTALPGAHTHQYFTLPDDAPIFGSAWLLNLGPMVRSSLVRSMVQAVCGRSSGFDAPRAPAINDRNRARIVVTDDPARGDSMMGSITEEASCLEANISAKS